MKNETCSLGNQQKNPKPLNDVQISSVNILGTKISIVNMRSVLKELENEIKAKQSQAQMVCVPNVHSVIIATKDQEFRKILNSAPMAVPDGMPLVWVSRFLGKRIPERVSGPDILYAFSKIAAKKGYSFFFMGAAAGTADKMAKELKREHPFLKVVGTYSPPYGKFSREENRRIIEMVNKAKPDVLWVAMTAPKQEKWIWMNKMALKIPVAVGVGAAFDFLSGNVRRAPVWIQKAGLEWLWRLIQEPKRLWKRYLVDDMKFFWLVFKQKLNQIKNPAENIPKRNETTYH